MYFYISCSLWWSPTALTPEKRSVTWFMRDKKCSKLFLRIEVNINRISIVFCVCWYWILVGYVSLYAFFESLKLKVMIESGVVCRSLCSVVGQMCFQKMAYILYFTNESWVQAYILGIEVYCPPRVLIYFPPCCVALNVLKNHSEKYR